MVQDVIDDIYEAAFAPAKWASGLDQMAKLSTSASTAMLVFSDRYASPGVVSPGFADILQTNSSPLQVVFGMLR